MSEAPDYTFDGHSIVPIESIWPDGETSWEAGLKKLGFFISPELVLGEEDVLRVSVHFRDADTEVSHPYQHLVAIDTIGHWYTVFIPDFPELMGMLRYLAPICTASILSNLTDEEGMKYWLQQVGLAKDE